MRHPFDGVENSTDKQPEQPSRRGILAILGAALAALLGLGVSKAQAFVIRRPPTHRRGESGGRPTTLALGEEGGRPSTRAFGEEGGRPTTYALGEEGGRPSTRALGEEGGSTHFFFEEGGRGN